MHVLLSQFYQRSFHFFICNLFILHLAYQNSKNFSKRFVAEKFNSFQVTFVPTLSTTPYNSKFIRIVSCYVFFTYNETSRTSQINLKDHIALVALEILYATSEEWSIMKFSFVPRYANSFVNENKLTSSFVIVSLASSALSHASYISSALLILISVLVRVIVC